MGCQGHLFGASFQTFFICSMKTQKECLRDSTQSFVKQKIHWVTDTLPRIQRNLRLNSRLKPKLMFSNHKSDRLLCLMKSYHDN